MVPLLVSLCVINMSVNYSHKTISPSAAPDDYRRVLTLVTFHIGDYYPTRQCFHVDIVYDDIPEPEEYFFLYVYTNDVQVYIPDGTENTSITIMNGKDYCMHNKYFAVQSLSLIPIATNCPDLLDPAYGSVNVTGMSPGDKAYYECDDGFTLKGPKTRVCQSDATWSGEEPECLCMF